MKIEHLKINHLTNPLGFDLSYPAVSYIVTEAKGKKQASARVEVSKDEDFASLFYDSGVREDIVSTSFELPVRLDPMTRYFWRVTVTDETGDTAVSDVHWFETARTLCAAGDDHEDGNRTEWLARWITPSVPKEWQMAVYKDIMVEKPVRKARAYMTGLGLYEFWLNHEKQGDECLMPGFCDYDSWIQYQTYEISLNPGLNRFEIILADGWYKGWYGLRKKSENYGDRLAAFAEIHITYEDGTSEVIGTDTSWKARKSRIVNSGIYPGETYDASLDVSEEFGTEEISLGYERLSPRLSPPVTVHERIRPVSVITSPKGETILDMGQNMVGWITFRCNAPAGTKIYLQTGEILQDGCFYNDNLRTALSEFTYISDGQDRIVRQHFTFYGFRYVKVEGWQGEILPEDFEGLVIHSEMEETGDIVTSDDLVNQLVRNARWGMKGNFVDVPTDCPQRDERYGWTGDAQIFSGTASFFMDTCAFYTKFGHDLYMEQKKLNGSVPDVVPVANNPGDASTAWGDAATIIPWNVYLHFGDTGILRRQYQSMKGWVDYMKREDDADGGKRLWLSGTHYGDWLALDGNVKGGVYGATDPGFIASAYYYYSTNIVAKTAAILGKTEDAAFYKTLAEEIYDAFVKEYYTPSGRLAVDTMTGYTVALFMGLTPDYALKRNRKGLLNKLKKNFYHLNTGFVGTPYLCRALSENGMNDLSYHLLMEKGYPGWLYEVLMGATTIWERWNSVEPDGKISGTEMNSLNHYSYGSIVEWMFRYMVGINPCEDGAGFKKFRVRPMPNYRFQNAKGSLMSASGQIVSSWEIDGKMLKFCFTVPFDTCAELVLPDAELSVIREEWEKEGYGSFDGREKGGDVVLTVPAGTYRFAYEPTVPCRKIYNLDSPLKDLCENPGTRKILQDEYDIDNRAIPFRAELCTFEELTWGPFTCIPQEQRDRIDRLLREVE